MAVIKNFGNLHVNEVNIGKNVKISDDVEIICDKLIIGDGSVLTGNTRILCKECSIGDNNFLNSIWIESALNAGNTKIEIGNENLILQNTRLNCNEYLKIGNDVNIGQNVSIWTHASSMNVMEGYPFTKAPVSIGSHVWITAETTILPGVKIGSNIIIGNKSIVNRDLPSGCFAAGCPVKIIKEQVYPKKLDIQQKKTIIQQCIEEYTTLMKLKHFKAEIKLIDDLNIEFKIDNKPTIFDIQKRKIIGEIDEYVEDFRDFLRYRGIKIFTNKPFHSISPNWYSEALSKDFNLRK
jgi:acetyltransferase-like isoleucine patch superfamily enzyme